MHLLFQQARTKSNKIHCYGKFYYQLRKKNQHQNSRIGINQNTLELCPLNRKKSSYLIIIPHNGVDIDCDPDRDPAHYGVVYAYIYENDVAQLLLTIYSII